MNKVFALLAIAPLLFGFKGNPKVKKEGVQSKPVVLLELFTSQGCSSCPPADAYLSELIQEQASNSNFVALSFHVDYWDYLGWQDPYSDNLFSERQRVYAEILANGRVYTPQIIVNGIKDFVGSNKEEIASEIEKQNQKTAAVTIQLSKIERVGNSYVVSYKLDGEVTGSAINIALFEKEASNEVSKGENQNKNLKHKNVVRAFKTRLVDSESGVLTLDFDESITSTDLGLAIYIQDTQTFQVLGAVCTDKL